MFYCSFFFFFFFFSSRDLLDPLADLREILQRGRKLVRFINAGLKVWGSAPQKNLGGKKYAKFGTISNTFSL